VDLYRLRWIYWRCRVPSPSSETVPSWPPVSPRRDASWASWPPPTSPCRRRLLWKHYARSLQCLLWNRRRLIGNSNDQTVLSDFIADIGNNNNNTNDSGKHIIVTKTMTGFKNIILNNNLYWKGIIVLNVEQTFLVISLHISMLLKSTIFIMPSNLANCWTLLNC